MPLKKNGVKSLSNQQQRTAVFRNKADGLLAKLNHARAQSRDEKVEATKARNRVAVLIDAQALVQQVAQEVQQRAHEQIARVVSRSLEAVFDDPYEFNIHFEQKRGRTEARLTFNRNGLEVDPMMASGGGVVDVASFALRLSCLILHRPPLRKILILDEPFRFVSPEYRGRIRTLLEELSSEMGIQIILVTHMEELQVGTVIRLPI